MLSSLLFLAGLLLLLAGAHYLVTGASSLAKRFKIPELVIGLTIVALGTSSPELTVNLFSAAKGATDMAIGNVVGSNIFNILVILGVSALIYPLKVQSSTVWKEIPLSLLAAILLFFMANDAMIDQEENSIISRIDGIVFLAFFIIFIYYTFGVSQNGGYEEGGSYKEYNLVPTALMILGGLGGLVYGASLMVNSAITIAKSFGLSEGIIGLTIVSAGTSLPELATSGMAAYRKNTDIAVGNIIGSNIFNIFLILGITSLIHPLPFNTELNKDILLVIAGSIFLFLGVFLGKISRISRIEGAVLVIIYIGYITYLLWN